MNTNAVPSQSNVPEPAPIAYLFYGDRLEWLAEPHCGGDGHLMVVAGELFWLDTVSPHPMDPRWKKWLVDAPGQPGDPSG